MRAAGMLLAFGCVAVAAPVPFHRGTGMWKGGWDAPTDPGGLGAFEVKKDELTIAIRSGSAAFDRPTWEGAAPRMMRPAKGDFVAQVRVELDGRPSAVSVAGSGQGAVTGGLVVTAGGKTVLVSFTATGVSSEGNEELKLWVPDGGYGWGRERSSDQKVVFIRLERAGPTLRTSFSADGRKWREGFVIGTRLPAEVKVGVIAASTSRDPARVRFRDFRLGPFPDGTKRPAAASIIGED